MNESQQVNSQPVCAWRDSAMAHILGNLSNDESQAYAAHLARCGACLEEHELAREVVARVDLSVCAQAVQALSVEHARELGSALDVPGSAAQVRRRLLEEIAHTTQDVGPELTRTWQTWHDDETRSGTLETAAKAGLFSVEASAGEWQSITPVDSGLPRIDVKRLSLDTKRRYVTMLVRMAPGASYPSHRHAGNEECFVIAGDLTVADPAHGEAGGGERVLHAGDYQLAAQNSVHGVQSTEHGCTLLIVSSQDDQLIN